MIYGVGIDMVEISRIDKALKRWGHRFLKRVFTRSEIEYCQDKTRSASRFAVRFAAKEAFSKALGSGFSRGVGFQQIEVIRASNGRPGLSLHGKAEELLQSCGIKKSLLSLSDDGLYAVAVVVLEM